MGGSEKLEQLGVLLVPRLPHFNHLVSALRVGPKLRFRDPHWFALQIAGFRRTPVQIPESRKGGFGPALRADSRSGTRLARRLSKKACDLGNSQMGSNCPNCQDPPKLIWFDSHKQDSELVGGASRVPTDPKSSELGTFKAVESRFWTCLSSEGVLHVPRLPRLVQFQFTWFDSNLS